MPSLLAFRDLASVLRRKAVAIGSACLLVACLLWLARPIWIKHMPPRDRHVSSILGSSGDYISKGPQAEDKVIVMGRIEGENVDWVGQELPDWQHAIYHMDDPNSTLHPPLNKGREAMAYLTFLVDHYDSLPEIMVFLHAHLMGWPESWHTDAPDYSNINSVRSLRLDYVRENGYANMRCLYTPGCPDEVQPFRNDPERRHEQAFADAYTYFFGGNHTGVPHTVGAACCSQFALSRDRVLARPKTDYERYRKWLLETDLTDDVSGRVMEYMWHMIFGKDPVWCPDHAGCWCEQFGRC